MIYCDTSLLIAALSREDGSARAQAWVAQRGPGELCISGWVLAEFSGAIVLKSRTGQIAPELRAEIKTRWREYLATTLTTLDLPAGAFELAAQFCDMREVQLRSGDALHLAVASLGGHSLATLDRAMVEAAIAVGVAVEKA